MPERTLHTEEHRDAFIRLLQQYKLPCTVSVRKGGHRSTEQNRLQHLWHAEAAEQLGDETPEEKRAYCKLHFGVPILREHEDFREQYDKTMKGLPYETKLALMEAPIDFPVTRLMTSSEKRLYLDAVYRHYTSLGVRLTEPRAA